MQSSTRPRVAVVGGGIAGLTAAAFAARAGAHVTLFESMSQLGGRARTREDAGFRFNMGPHALYRGGPAESVLAELDVEVSGRRPDVSSALASNDGRLHMLPGGPLSLLTTSLLSAREKLALGRGLARLPELDPAPWFGRPLRDLLDETLPTPRVRNVLAALARLTTYVHAPDHLCAGTVIVQIAAALTQGVRYLDGGWQTMVEALAERARAGSADVRSRARVHTIEAGENLAVELADGAKPTFDAVVLAMGPAEASALVSSGAHPVLAHLAATSLPVRATCLDLGLSRLPDPKVTFVLGIDRPTYLSLHSVAASGLAPASGGVVLQLARYLGPEEKPDRADVSAELEALLDAAQPGWRALVTTRRLLSELRVAHAIPTARTGGVPGRPPVDALAATHPGLLLAGDWIGPRGWLVDAAFSSGRDAGRLAARVARARCG